MFDKEKQDVLKKLQQCDKSKKGSVDEDIKELVDAMNSTPDYYTTSSCSGRIMLIDKGKGRKDLAEWLLSSHKIITKRDFGSVFTKQYLESEEFKNAAIWFMEEPAILHVCARNLEAAKTLLEIVRKVPFKRSGIISFSRRIMIEILDTEKMETLVAKDGVLYVRDDYSRVLIEEANKKLRNTKKKIKKLRDLIPFE